MLVEIIIVVDFMIVSSLVLIIYISTCTYAQAFMDDLAVIIEQQSTTIEQRTSTKEKFVQFIQLHKDLYKYIT